VPLLGDRRRPEVEAKQLEGTNTDMEWHVIASLIITLEGKR